MLDLYGFMLTARILDEFESRLTRSGEVSFHSSGAGHESTAALAFHLGPSDWLHCHYRDTALMIARGVSPEAFFSSLLCKDTSHSRGRQLNVMMSCPELNLLSIVTPVGNGALQSVGVASAIRDDKENPIVLCGLGDGMTQQGEVCEAIGEAARDSCPVLFLIEDNQYALSTRTRGRTFYDMGGERAASFYGVPILYCSGSEAVECYGIFGNIVSEIRRTRKPRILVLHVPRLSDHSNADRQAAYRSPDELLEAQALDPIPRLEKHLLRSGISEAELRLIRVEAEERIQKAADAARNAPDPQPCFSAKAPLPDCLSRQSFPEPLYGSRDGLTMVEAIREVLRSHLEKNDKVTLFGEDIEDPKGDVFGVTKGLSTQFPGRVRNSPLSESTIVGKAIGQALAGGRPVAFLQFADFIPLAFNQIMNELGSMYWRTDGGWQAPVIVMIACGGYRPGLGPFHAQTLESIAAHVPGIDVMMPSNAADAAGLLNAAFKSNRPTLFFYPKSLLNDRQSTLDADAGEVIVPIGRARITREGKDLTFVGWGNTVRLCEQVAETLSEHGFSAEIVDLRTLSPLDEETIQRSAEKTGRIIAVHEDNRTCGLAAEVLACVSERLKTHVRMTRVTRPDTYVPCNYANQLSILPSCESILEAAAELLDFSVEWRTEEEEDASLVFVKALALSPADEFCIVVELYVKAGDKVKEGDVIAAVETNKAVAELASPASGVIEDVFVEEGQTVAVDERILSIRVKPDDGAIRRKEPATRRSAVLSKRTSEMSEKTTSQISTAVPARATPVYISGVASSLGSRTIHNETLLKSFPDWSTQDVIKRIGIESRKWIGEGESALTLALAACTSLFEKLPVGFEDISAIVCSTGTPISASPSMACEILTALAGNRSDKLVQAFDINAACSGYLYGLQVAHDMIQSSLQSHVLLVTTEVLSPLLNLQDQSTVFIFADAATATLISSSPLAAKSARVKRPVLSAKGDVARTLSIPFIGGAAAFITMEGVEVAIEAGKGMSFILTEACSRVGLTPNDLDLVIPHQANKRILAAVQRRLNLPEGKVYTNLKDIGNTSSSTIPICLDHVLPRMEPESRIGLVAFGAGFTFGAAILETV